jgi:hypothetical protein
MHAFSPYRRRSQAFSLVEVMIVLGVSGLVLAGLMGFFIQGLNIYHYDSAKLMVNRDIRKFTSEMTENATYSNYFQIFKSFTDRNDLDVDGNPRGVEEGQSGDLLVLVFVEDPPNDSKIRRLVGYYRDGSSGSEGPVRKFDIPIPPARADERVFDLLPDVSTISGYPEVIELARGLSNQKLFYHFGDSIIVKGQIIHRGGLKNTRYERATNTYNFTIYPRG